MIRDEDVRRLIGLTYEAALEPSAWQTLLDEIVEMLDGHTATLWASLPDGSLRMVGNARYDPEFQALYQQHYFRLDPWVIAGVAQNLFRPGVVRLGEEVVRGAELRKSPFFNEIGRRFNLVGGIAAIYGIGGSFGSVSLMQRHFDHFGPEERQLLEALSPHLDRALRITRRLAAAPASPLADFLDQLPAPIVLTTAEARPKFMNRAAQGLMNHGLASGPDGLSTVDAAEGRALRALIASCDPQRHPGRTDTGGRIRIARTAVPPLRVTVIPLSPDAAAQFPGAVAMLWIDEPSSVPVADAILVERFGLTPAEARVARLLAAGATVAEIATRHSVAANTIRTHLKRIFQKTQTRTQAQLVHLVLAL